MPPPRPMSAQQATDNRPIRYTERVGVFWDVETYGISPSMQAYTTVTTISHKCTSYGALTTFRAYLERNDGLNPLTHTRDILTLHGVTLLQYPQATRASNFEKLLITDLFTFALDNPAPSTIVLITNAELSIYPISALRNRHFKIILVSQYPLAFQGLAAQASEVVEWSHFLGRPRESRMIAPSSSSPTQSSASVSSRITTARPSPRTTSVDLLTQSPRHSTVQPPHSTGTTSNPTTFSPLRQPLSTPSTFNPFMGGLGSRLPASRTPWSTSTIFPSSLGTGTWGQSTITQQHQPQQPSFAGGNISGRGPHHLHSAESTQGLRGPVPELSYLQTQTHPDLNTEMSMSSTSPVEMQPTRYRAVTSMLAERARQRYFDPSEDTERKFVGLGQRVRTRFESLNECPDSRRQDDTNRGSNIRKPSSEHDSSHPLHTEFTDRFPRPDIEMQSPNPPAVTSTVSSPALTHNPGVTHSHERASLQNTALEDSQTQEQVMPIDWVQPGLGEGKRKHLDGPINEDPRPLKKLKYSVAREPVELEG